jgi:hypothetical protein
MGAFFRKNKRNLLLVASLILNALGGAGLIPPVVSSAANTAISAAQNPQ